MNQPSRREFLRTSLAATSAAVLGATSEAYPAPSDPSKWEKHGIIIEPTEPWEGGHVQNFTTRAEPLNRGAWRIWYSVSDARLGYNIAFAEGVPGETMKKTRAVWSASEPADAAFAIGNLPEKWKPVQPIHVPLRDGRHRLYFWAHGPGICRYLAAESEDGRRYRVIDPLRPVLYHPNDRAASGVSTPDGVMYRPAKSNDRPEKESPANATLISNDATNVYQLADGSWEIYTVALLRVPKTDPAYIPEDNAPGLLRVIDRFTSADGLHFENRRRVIQREAGDPLDQQFYYLSVTHTLQGRVGMLGHYRCKAQTMDLEWCFSGDGLNWERPKRSAWLPRGNSPDADCLGIYAGNQLVQSSGRWHLFYTGTNSTHNGKESHGRARQVVLLATSDSIFA